VLQYTDRFAGGLLVLVGVYLVYYGVHATGSLDASRSNPIGVIEEWSSWATTRLEDGGTRLGVEFAAITLFALCWALWRRRAK
jgi:hypothetical protein